MSAERPLETIVLPLTAIPQFTPRGWRLLAVGRDTVTYAVPATPMPAELLSAPTNGTAET